MSERETTRRSPLHPQDSGIAATETMHAPQVRARRAISIVIACCNESKHVRAFVDSLLAQDLAAFDWEIIIADGASTDGTRRVLREYARRDSRITVIDNPARIVSSGLNAAIRAARGEIILRMDAHTEYAPDYVRACVEALEKTAADNVGGPARTRAEGLLPRAIQAAYHSRFSTGGARFHDDNYSGYVDTVPYGCWRKETLLKLGLFDEELVRNQDDEFNLRLTRAGGKIWQSSDIVSWYRPRATLSALFRQYFQYGFWKVRVIRKHKIPGSWRHLIPAAFIAANFALLLATAVAAILGDGTPAQKFLIAWAALLALYVAALLAASCFSARRFGWRLLPYLPAAFATFHCSYGLGFLAGSLYWTFARRTRPRLGDFFVGVTR
ncbi:MAG TPA: glycosyltransferase family 2 protein [Candidatus Acidoferrales bacterium]|nr:glycosyltransferase family 2 protein [Candidatus Acidoferrales bacterium]